MENVKRLVYVSTNPKIVIKNFADLCRPGNKDGSGTVFLPTKAIPVDIFPHTTHCQLVLCFERTDLSTLPTRKKLPPLIKNLDSLRGVNGRGGRGGFNHVNNKMRLGHQPQPPMPQHFRQNNHHPILLTYPQGLKMCPPLIEAPSPHELFPLVNPFSFPELIFNPRARSGFAPQRRVFPQAALPPGMKRPHPASLLQIPVPPNPLESLLLRQQFLDLPQAAMQRLPHPMRARGMRRGIGRPLNKK